MFILEETDEYRFVRHVTGILGVPNTRPDLEPGGLWLDGKFRLSWGLRTATEPPTFSYKFSYVLNGGASVPYDLPARLAVWRTAFANRENSPDLQNMDFRDVVKFTAILAWNPETAEPDDGDDHDP